MHSDAGLPGRLDPLDAGTGANVHPLPAEHLGDQLGRLGLLGAGEPRAWLDDGDPCPEAGHDLPDFEAHRSAAGDEEGCRHGLGGHRPAVGPVRDRGEQGRDVGLLPGGEDEGVACRDRLAADLDRHGARHPGLAADEATPLLAQAIDGHFVVPEVGGLLPDTAGHGRPVRCHYRGTRHTWDPPPLGEKVRCPHHHFGGDTSPVGALAADQLGLNADDLESGFRQLLRHLFAARAQPDDDGVDFHRSTTRPSW